jgi:hypothetical protein
MATTFEHLRAILTKENKIPAESFRARTLFYCLILHSRRSRLSASVNA